jgi:hypothetical protein
MVWLCVPVFTKYHQRVRLKEHKTEYKKANNTSNIKPKNMKI